LLSAAGALCTGGPLAARTLAPDGGREGIYLLVGSYAAPDEEGIKVYRFDGAKGEAEYVDGLKGLSNPSYLACSQDGNYVYAVGEDGQDTSTANALRFDRERGTLALLGAQRTGGGAPCYIALDPTERFVLTANYTGGSITVFARGEEGALLPESRLIRFSGKGPDPERQAQPHLHCVVFTPDGRYLLANDLGTDKIRVFPVAECAPAGSAGRLLDESAARDVAVKPGSGPRHLCFSPDGRFAYLIHELSGQVTVFSYRKGRLKALQYIAADTTGARGSGDIHISPDGRFVYASNRLRNDGLAIFAVDRRKGTLTAAGYQPTGIHPRNFIITPDGRWLLVACRDSNAIQIFARDIRTGLLTDTGRTIATPKPVCLKFID